MKYLVMILALLLLPTATYATLLGAGPTFINNNTLAANFNANIGTMRVMLSFGDDGGGGNHWSSGSSGGVAGYAGFVAFLYTSQPALSNAIPDFSMPMSNSLDDANPTAAFTAISNGSRDTAITGMINAFKSAGFTKMYLRPGWEMNLPNTWGWSAPPGSGLEAGYVAAFRHIYTLVHAITGIQVVVVWCPAAAFPITGLYPGNGFVDVIGLDPYNNLDQTVTSTTSIKTIAQMAVANGKPMSADETGINTGDVTAWPAFMTNVTNAFNSVPGVSVDHIIYYVSDPALGGDPVNTPTAAAAIKADFAAIQALSESPAGTTVTTVGPSINASPTPGSAGGGNVLTITAGAQIALNGTTLGGANVIKLYYTGASTGANGALSHSAYQENASLNWFGPITASSVGAQVSSPLSATVSNGLPDLSNAAAHPTGGTTGFPASKAAYAIQLSPTNVTSQTPDTPLATLVPIWNAYFGSAAGSVPVANLEVGCSCDGTNGALADDQAFMTAWVTYANGLASGGPTFTTTQQPLSNDWLVWGNFPGSNPDGTLNPNGTLKLGQQNYWSSLLFGTTSAPPPPPAATWNPGDENNMTLSGNNLISTAGASGIANVRTTTSKSSGKFCWEITATTISADWGVGIANATFNLAAGLSSDANGMGFFPGNLSGFAQAVFLNNTELTVGTNPSVSGDKITECHDFDAGLDWLTDTRMRTDSGAGAWNNSGACNPTVAACGLSTSGLTCPCFPIFHDAETGVAALNTVGSFAVTLPAGFATFDNAPVLSTGRPIAVIIMGANDNRPASNDNAIRVSLNNRSTRQ